MRQLLIILITIIITGPAPLRAGIITVAQDGSGDVKYHQGFSSNVQTPGGEVHLALAFNPSHLEKVKG